RSETKKGAGEEPAPFLFVLLSVLRTRSAAARVLLLVAADRHAGRCVEQLLQERHLAAARDGFAGFEIDDVTVFQAKMFEVADLAVLVEIDGEDGAGDHARLEKGNPLLSAGDVVPGVAAESRLRRRIAEAGLHRRLGVLVLLQGRFIGRIGQIAALADDRRATRRGQNANKKKGTNAHAV